MIGEMKYSGAALFRCTCSREKGENVGTVVHHLHDVVRRLASGPCVPALGKGHYLGTWILQAGWLYMGLSYALHSSDSLSPLFRDARGSDSELNVIHCKAEKYADR